MNVNSGVGTKDTGCEAWQLSFKTQAKHIEIITVMQNLELKWNTMVCASLANAALLFLQTFGYKNS